MKKAFSLILSTAALLMLAYLVRPAWALQGFSGGIPTSGPGSGTVTSVTSGGGAVVTNSTTTPVISIPGPTVNVLAPPSGCTSCTMVGDDSTDNTTAFSNILSYLQANGGGTIYLPSENTSSTHQIYRANSCVILPNGGGSSPTQSAIRFTGDVGSANANRAFSGGTQLDLRGQCSYSVLTAQSGTTFTPTAATDGPGLGPISTTFSSGQLGSIITFTMASTSGLVAGQQIAVTGMTPSTYNMVEGAVIAVTGTTITVWTPNSGLANASGFGTITIISLVLPQSTITVDQTAGYANGSNTILIGNDQVTCTGTSSTTFTGCSGGTHTWSIGNVVEPYNAASTAVAKIDTRGLGTLAIDHISFVDNGSDCSPFIQTTGTVLHVGQNVGFFGTGNQTAACNDVFVFGGTGTTQNATANSPFQGYGTDVSAGVTYAQVRRVGVFNTFANQIVFRGGYVDSTSGSNLSNGAAFDFYGGVGANPITGIVIRDVGIETEGYPYSFNLNSYTQASQFVDNSFYDDTSTTIGYYHVDDPLNSTGNYFESGFYALKGGQHILVWDAEASSTQTILDTNDTFSATQLSQRSVFLQPPTFLGSVGASMADASGDLWTQSMAGGNGTTLNISYEPFATRTVYTPVKFTLSTSTLAQETFNGSSENIIDGLAGGTFLFRCGTSDCQIAPNNVDKLDITPTAISALAGATIQSTGGTLPTLTTGCGAGNANAGSTNNRGSVTTGTTETTCTLAFSASGTWSQTPFCICGDANASITPLGCSVGATSTSSVVFDFAAATAKKFNYMCE